MVTAFLLHVPEDVKGIIEEVYGDRSPERLSQALQERWKATRQALDKAKGDHAAKARQFSVLPPTYPDNIFEDFNRELEEDDPEAHPTVQALTRLTERTVPVVFLSTGEGQALNLATKPKMIQVKALLRRSLTVFHRAIAPLLIREDVPQGWRQSPLLRHYRLVELDADGKARRGNHVLSLNSELGLRIVSPGREEG